MRLSTLMLLAMAFIASPCQAGEADNIQIARDMIAAINARELDRLDNLVAADVVRHSTATPGVSVTSLDDFRNFLTGDFASVPDSVITIDVIFGNDDHVGIRAVYSGTQSGQMGPFPPSGKHVDLPFLGILRIEQGKVAEMWVEWDNLHMLSQLGHLNLADPE